MLDDPILNRRPEEKMFDSAFDVSVSCGGSTTEGSAERGESSDKQSSGLELERKDLKAEATQALKACQRDTGKRMCMALGSRDFGKLGM